MDINISKKFIEKVIETAIRIQQVSAPTFGEKKRAELVYSMFHDAGLKSIEKDSIYNIYGVRPGISAEKMILLSAHTDTVFPDNIDLAIKKEDGRIFGPGIGDNSLGVAALIAYQEYLNDMEIQMPFDICFLANSREEGLGDLQGIKKALERYEKKPDAIIVLEGFGYEDLCVQGIGSKRYKIKVKAPGGHSWSDFGQESAIHVLVKIAAELTAMKIPHSPKSSFNIGTITGGTSVNTIAQKANCLLDFRSESRETLNTITKQAESIVQKFQINPVDIELEVIGERPAGSIGRDHWFTRVCLSTFEETHNKPPKFKAISTDANIPLSQGIPTVCIGLTDGNFAHRIEEFIETKPLTKGLSFYFSLVAKTMEVLK